jgi:hypothetical protein
MRVRTGKLDADHFSRRIGWPDDDDDDEAEQDIPIPNSDGLLLLLFLFCQAKERTSSPLFASRQRALLLHVIL